MKIEYLDPVHCKADKELRKIIKPCLAFKSNFWKPGQFSQKKVVQDRSMINQNSGIFLTGLLPRVLNYLIKKEIKFKFNKKNREYIIKENEPNLKGITLRDDQLELIDNAFVCQRGVLKSPTGSGKSIVAAGIISCLPSKNILFLCHSLSILTQIKSEFEKFEVGDINFIQGKNKKLKRGINIASIQTFVKINPDEYMSFFDVVIQDEVHHCQKLKSQYGEVLQNLIAFMKIGFTATLPEGKEKNFVLEGLFGPIIGEVTINESIEKGAMVKPKITLLPVKFNEKITDCKSYQDIYKHGIVENKYRNRSIVIETLTRIINNKTCLIMVKDIRHGELLMEGFNRSKKYKNKIIFIQGGTESKTRNAVKKALEDKKIKCVIVTSIWREGVSIKSLDCVVLALGGKSAIQILQAIGRGTRVSEGKKEVEILDFVDNAKYLSQHFCQRLSIYLDNSWL